MEELKHLATQLDEALDYAQGLSFITRAVELQEKQVKILETFSVQISNAKSTAIQESVESTANWLLAVEFIIQGHIQELLMWIHLKKDNMAAAWDNLVDAQDNFRAAMQSHKIGDEFSCRVERLAQIEMSIFPPQSFVSISCVIEKSICTICGKYYDECEHVVGKAYMGRLCAQEIHNIDLRSIDLVEDPADKHCRAYGYSEGSETVDIMTWRRTPNIN